MMAGNTNTFIIDASYLLSFLLADEQLKEAEEIFDQFSVGKIKLYAPSLLPFEVLSALQTATARKRITSQTAQELAKYFLDLKIPILNIDLFKTFVLAQLENLTFYDASYLYLAKTHHAPLLTLDEKLQSFNTSPHL